ncbi:MAG: metallophosphoesterase, partial [Acidimicrobiia bacterium]|nr:metallophosphoesterase [Acidimicrobiia bacterium]
TALRALNAESERPAAVIATGDLVECGKQQAYDLLVEIMADLELPFWPLPGNHDSNRRLQDAFPHMPWEENHASWVKVVPGSHVTVIGLDSTTPGESGGHVDVERLDWLADAIEAAAGPTVLAMHHPPFLTGIDWMDGLGFKGLDQLQQVLEAHPPSRIIAGHYHRSIVSQVGRSPASVGIATAPHVNLDLSNASVPAVINDPIGYELHCVLPDDKPQVITHTRYIDRASVAQPIKL